MLDAIFYNKILKKQKLKHFKQYFVVKNLFRIAIGNIDINQHTICMETDNKYLALSLNKDCKNDALDV